MRFSRREQDSWEGGHPVGNKDLRKSFPYEKRKIENQKKKEGGKMTEWPNVLGCKPSSF